MANLILAKIQAIFILVVFNCWEYPATMVNAISLVNYFAWKKERSILIFVFLLNTDTQIIVDLKFKEFWTEKMLSRPSNF